MRYDRILRRVWVKIDGREYALVFSLSVFEKLDAENDGNLIVQLSQGDTHYKLLSHAFKLALQQADKKSPTQRPRRYSKNLFMRKDFRVCRRHFGSRWQCLA